MSTQLIEKSSADVSEKTYFEYIDVLRVISMLSVVFLHTAAGSLRVNLGSNVWHFSNILTAIMSTSVPIFFMISGAMLLCNNKTSSISSTYKKRLPKALIPFIAWTVVAIVYYGLLGKHSTGNFLEAKIRIKNILNTPATIHLWFMYALIPLYLLSPILKNLVDGMSKTLARYCLILWFIFSSLLPTLSSIVPTKFSPLFTLNKDYNLNFMNGYIGYFLLGFYLLTYKNKVSIRLLSLVILIDTAVIALGTWYKTMYLGQYSEIFKVYSKAFVLILSVAIFLFFKEVVSRYPLKPFVLNLVKFLSGLSFGVYLMHNLLIDALGRFTSVLPVHSILKLLVSYGIVLSLTLLTIFVVSSIKYTCYLFTGQPYQSACKCCNLQFFILLLKKKRT